MTKNSKIIVLDNFPIVTEFIYFFLVHSPINLGALMQVKVIQMLLKLFHLYLDSSQFLMH